MFKFKSAEPYWSKFSSYQSFQTVDELNAAVKKFVAVYDLTDAIKAVLNTIKLHSKRFFGVCWLRKEKKKKKAKVSMSTVDRAIKGLKESGFLTVKAFKHTKFGRQTHNIYILNPIFDVPEEVPNEVAQEVSVESSNPVVPTVCNDQSQTHKNPNTNSNKNLKNLSIKLDNFSIDESKHLKHVPNEFINLLEPFYGHSPKIIRDRWKTVCSAVKRNCCGSFEFTSWESIAQAWKDVVTNLKRGKIKNSTDDGIGAYFYGVLCDYMMDDMWRNGSVKG